MARVSSRGLVWRKLAAKLQADEQEHHLRHRLEARWHKASKPRELTAAVNDAAVQRKCMLFWGDMLNRRLADNQRGSGIQMSNLHISTLKRQNLVTSI